MKLERYWLFKDILLKFSYILTISMDYILLISSVYYVRNEVQVGKLPIIASYTGNFISKLLQGNKNMVAFLLICKSYWLFCVGSLDCQ